MTREKLFSEKSIPLAFFLIALLSYGLLIPWTGFYWDDWGFAWIAKFLGPAEFISAFRGFRPFLGPIFYVTTSLIPPNPLLWQIFALLIRFAAALSAWFALDRVWPKYKRQTLIASFLFLVFPGYSQNWVALTHINQEWIPFIFYLLSFGYTGRALRRRDVIARSDKGATKQSTVVDTTLALLLLILGVFPTEYFLTIEPLRFLFIWVIISDEAEGWLPRLLETLKRWWPYALIWLTNIAWLAYYYKSGAYISYDVATVQQIPSVGHVISVFADALWKAGLYVWAQVLVLTGQSISAPANLLTLVLILIAFALLAFYFLHLNLPSETNKAFARAAILIGLVGILLGRIPSFAAGLPLTLQSSFDRFMVSMMLGGSLFVTGLIEFAIRNARAKTYIFALLIALGIGQQFFNANIFRRDWQRQQEIYWQMAWRIPALKEHTTLLTDYVPIDYETDLSFTGPINWIYARDLHPPDLPYAMLYLVERLGGSAIPDLQPGTAIQLPYRDLTFHGNISQVIVISAPQNGCLHVYDPAFENGDMFGNLPDSLSAAIPLSDPSRILADAPSPVLPDPPFTREPDHTWCYFYEKAELARQMGNWKEVAELGHEAAKGNFVPENLFEWLPFIEGYARSGDLKTAEQITRLAWTEEPKTHKGLCDLWKRVRAEGPNDAQAFAFNVLSQDGCNQ